MKRGAPPKATSAVETMYPGSGNRLSITPVSAEEWQSVLALLDMGGYMPRAKR